MIKSLSYNSSDRVVGMIVGPSGVGKTFLASTLEGRTLIASAESGLLCLKKLPAEAKERIDVFEIKNIEDYKQFFITCLKPETKKKYQNLFIDSLTEIGERILTELKDDPKYLEEKMMLKLYGKFNDDFAKYVKALRDMSPYNVWFTCLNKYEKDGMSLKEEFSFPGAKTKDSIKAWLDIVLKYEIFEKEDQKFRMLISDYAINPLSKDRSGQLDQYEPAHLGNIMKKIKGE
jgi:energy-coupling factor transporter ATP-binding protein EcfA2